jgi:transposase
MIPFLNRNDEKWPHTRQMKIAGRNHILPPLGIAWKTKHRQFPRGIELKLNVKLSKMSSTGQFSS